MKDAKKLTKRVVDATTATDDEVYVWDSELRGFGLRAYATGRKTYFVQFRAKGRQRKYTIGQHGVLTPDEARDIAREVLASVAKGGDPAADRSTLRSDLTFRDLLDLYLKNHAEIHQAPRTAKENRRLIDKHIAPQMGTIRVRSVTRQDVAKFHLGMRETPGTANRALSVITKALNLAEEWELRDWNTNPSLKLKKYPEETRERFLSVDELERLGQALADAETIGLPWVVDETKPKAKHLAAPQYRFAAVDPTALMVIRMLLVTGARLSEMTELKWENVDFDRETIALPRQKGKPRRALPVSTAAMSLLARIPKVKDCPWVFPRVTDPKRSISVYVMQSAWDRLRCHAGLSDVRMHDLRHTLATWAARTGANAFIIRDTLRHATVQMSSRYVNEDRDPVKALADTVGNALTAALEGRKADVINIMDKRRRET